MLDILTTNSGPAALLLVAAAVVATGIIGTRRRLGPNADWVEIVRTTCLPVLDPFVERYAGGVGTAYELDGDEFAGHIPTDPEDVEERLWRGGCRRNPVAALKATDDGRTEVGSWVFRGDGVGEQRQVHVMLFRTPDGGTDVYAHEEYSSALGWLRRDPDVLRKHYAGVDYRPKEGVQWVSERFKSVEPDGTA